MAEDKNRVSFNKAEIKFIKKLDEKRGTIYQKLN